MNALKPIDETTLNQPSIPKHWKESVIVGIDAICQFLSDIIRHKISSKRNTCSLAFDGFIGAEWDKIILKLRDLLSNEGFDVETINIFSYYKSTKEIEKMVHPYLENDPFFGRVFHGKLEDFLDNNKLDLLKWKLKSYRNRKAKLNSPKVIISYGCGAANRFLRKTYDLILFMDVTREEFVKRAQRRAIGFIKPKSSKVLDQVADVGLSVYLFKVSNYIYYPVLERYKRYILSRIDFYVDGNIVKEPKLVPRNVFEGILSILAEYPVRLKPLYIPSPWGGQWIKKIRKLPGSLVNCAWAFEAVTPEMSIKISVGKTFLEIPFLTFLLKESKKIMGEYAVKKFGAFFPIRVHYDDSMNGGNMAIQVHPPTSYVRKHFNERIGQDESYYIVLTGEGSRVFLGVKEKIDKNEFYEEVKKSEIEKTPLNYEKYVNSIASKPGDLFLIPAGTVHALGRNQVALEIGTIYGYTFHIYDYLRPDLSGKLRPIHPDHAFRVIKFERTSRWVNKYLKQPPRLIRSSKEWAEYCLGEHREIYYKVHRLEFKTRIDDDTNGKFHILTLVEGESIIVQSQKNPERKFKLKFSETVIVPACLGKYSIINLGNSPCKVVKVFLK